MNDLKEQIAKVFISDDGEGIEFEFDSDSAEYIFWYFISRLDKSTIANRISELAVPEKE